MQEWRKPVPLGKAWVSQLLELPCQKGSRPHLLWEKPQWEHSICLALVSHVVMLFKFSPQLL